jgi:hypothetical protein
MPGAIVNPMALDRPIRVATAELILDDAPTKHGVP